MGPYGVPSAGGGAVTTVIYCTYCQEPIKEEVHWVPLLRVGFYSAWCPKCVKSFTMLEKGEGPSLGSGPS